MLVYTGCFMKVDLRRCSATKFTSVSLYPGAKVRTGGHREVSVHARATAAASASSPTVTVPASS